MSLENGAKQTATISLCEIHAEGTEASRVGVQAVSGPQPRSGDAHHDAQHGSRGGGQSGGACGAGGGGGGSARHPAATPLIWARRTGHSVVSAGEPGWMEDRVRPTGQQVPEVVVEDEDMEAFHCPHCSSDISDFIDFVLDALLAGEVDDLHEGDVECIEGVREVKRGRSTTPVGHRGSGRGGGASACGPRGGSAGKGAAGR